MIALRRIADWPRRWRTGAVVGGALGLAGLCAVVATMGIGLAGTTAPAPLAGQPVPAADLPFILSAAASCPALTPPRLAGQLMAASGFAAPTAGGGVGIAALTDAGWQRWMPWPGALRTDNQANIVALAHQMCDLIGQVRIADLTGDPWPLALAGYQAGMPAVISTAGVPAAVSSYVDTVARYAAWYALQPQFGGAASTPPPTGSALAVAGTIPVPDAYLPSVLTAGHVCPQLTPSRVAAQLMAGSGFNPDRLGTSGAQGIAQFLPEVWARYAGSATATPWDASAAIPALGRAMCDLITQLTGLTGDPYQLALAAYQWGSAAVHQAGGVPASADLKAFIQQVITDAGYYARDPRLGVATTSAPTPSPTSSPTPSTPPAGGQPAVPEAYVLLINSAGHRCTGLTPAELAAQLSVESRFDPAATRAGGAQGIAMFLPAAWVLYRPAPTASPLDPAAAIPAAAHYMCDLLVQVRNAQLPGDAWSNALAAYRWGLGNLIAAHTVPAGTDASRYVAAVLAARAAYQQDPRLK